MKLVGVASREGRKQGGREGSRVEGMDMVISKSGMRE